MVRFTDGRVAGAGDLVDEHAAQQTAAALSLGMIAVPSEEQLLGMQAKYPFHRSGAARLALAPPLLLPAA